MKKIAILLVAVLTAGIFAGCSAGDTDEGSGGKKNVTLNVYNWGEYIDDEDFNVNEKFTEETGIKVNYKTFENNESMYTTSARARRITTSCFLRTIWWAS